MKTRSKSLFHALACAVILLGTVNLAQAAGGANVDVSGTWTWTGGGFGGGGGGGGFGGGGGGGGRRGGFGGGGTNILVLKADVSTGAVTGTLTPPAGGGRGRRGAAADDGTPPPAPTPIEIKNGKIAGNELSFEVTRAGRGGGAEITTRYTATVSADGKSLTGTTATPVAFTATKQ